MNLRDNAGELVEVDDLLNNFKISIFGVVGYKPKKNDAELIKYLSIYRKYQEQILNKQ